MKKIKNSSLILYLFLIHMMTLILNGRRYFTIGSRSVIYAIIIVLSVLYTMRNIKFNIGINKRTAFSMERILSAIIIIFSVVSIIFVNENFQRDIFLASILFFVLIFEWTGIEFEEKQIFKLKKYYIISALILAMGIILMRHKPYEGLSRMTILSYTGEFYDVNFISTYIVIPTILLLNDFIIEKSNQVYKFLESAILVISILLTGSRAALGVLGIAFLFILWKQKKLTNSLAFICIAIVIAIPIAIYKLPGDVLQHYLEGMNLANDSRRMMDWSYGLLLIGKKPLLGNGLVSTRSLIEMTYGENWITAHNTYIVFGVYFGLVFGTLVIILMGIPVYRFIRYKAPYIYLLAYAMYLVAIMIIEANYSDIMIIPTCIFYSISIFYKNEYLKIRKKLREKGCVGSGV